MCVSAGCLIRSLIYPFAPRSALLCAVTCRSPIFVLSAPKNWIREWLRQAIDDVHLNVDLPNFEFLLSYELPDVMKPYLDMFRLHVVDWISDEVYCPLGVEIDGWCWMVESSFRREVS